MSASTPALAARLEPAPALRGVSAYRSPAPSAPCDLLLAGNEGPPPPADLLSGLRPEDLRRYPSAAALEAALAERWGLTPDQVLVTAGADDALDRCCRALLCPGRSLIVPTPSFEMIARDGRLAGAEVRQVPWPAGPLPTEEILSRADATTRLVAIVSPNNPTGAVASAEDLRRLSVELPQALLLLDAAYGEFASEDLTPLALSLENAVVTRTLSKAWGLAGLRVGYVLGPPPVIAWLRAAGLPYPVAGPALAIAARWLDQGQARTQEIVAEVRRERAAIAQALEAGGLSAQPSEANFVLARGPRAAWLREGLASQGIAVRTWQGRPELADAVRVSCPAEPGDATRLERSIAVALRPEALLFDMDGVLADVSGSYRVAIEETAASYGVALEPGEIAAAKAKGDANDDWSLTQRLLAARGVDADLAEVSARFEALYQGGLWERETLLAQVELLERLAARFPLAIVTGRPRRDALRFLGQVGIASSFQVVIAREDAAALKPDPAPVAAALQALGVERAWLIGDTPDDVRAARAAGALPLGIVAPGDPPAETRRALALAGAGRVLAALSELLELLPEERA